MNRLKLIYTLPAIATITVVGLYGASVLFLIGALMVWGAGGMEEE